MIKDEGSHGFSQLIKNISPVLRRERWISACFLLSLGILRMPSIALSKRLPIIEQKSIVSIGNSQRGVGVSDAF